MRVNRAALAPLLTVALLAACSRSPDEAAHDGCKGVYDRYMRWTQKHQRRPETPTEIKEVTPKPGPWGTAYFVEVAQDTSVVVWSNGPDRKPDTADDIRYPQE